MSFLERGLIVLVFCICLSGALLLPVDQCPDERGRLLLTDYIVQNGALPTGNEAETMIPGWGFSYALRPYLSSILGALLKCVAALFTASPRVLLAAARICSVLSVIVLCIYCLRLGHILFERRSSAVLFAAFVCFLPQVMFLGMYQNNDALSLCTVSMMLYYWVDGYNRKWPIKSCAGLAVSFSLGLLSYYSVYGWILICAIFCVIAVLIDPEISNKRRLILNRMLLIAGICLVLAGWFFVRNAILHDGDFLGIAHEQISRERTRELGYTLYDYTCYRDQGVSVIDFLRMSDFMWLRTTQRSFVGVFGYLSLSLPEYQYGLYYFVLLAGTALYVAVLVRQKPGRRDVLLILMMLLSDAITFLLNFWQSYARDLQAQGRYIITLSLLFGYMTAYGLDKTVFTIRRTGNGRNAELHPTVVLTILWILMFARTALDTMTKMLP